ncbi:MAG: ISAs1 family transposase [Burkholderiales bacterium]|nr:ISAs1 family transposase [Burkholderiales bacterium]
MTCCSDTLEILSASEWRYYISSLQLGARDINERVRSHWRIENSCHWVLDMTYREDDSRIRIGHGAKNRPASNLIELDQAAQGQQHNLQRPLLESQLEHRLPRSRARPDSRLIWLIRFVQ